MAKDRVKQTPVADDSKIIEQQQLFNLALQHMRKQGGPSVSTDLDPMYHGPNKRTCATEPFITDYDPAMESEDWRSLAADHAAKLDPLAVKHASLVHEIQSCHDVPATLTDMTDADFMQDFEQRMLELAQRKGLEYANA